MLTTLLLVLLGVLLLALAAAPALDFVFQTTLSHGQDVVTSSVTISTAVDDKVYAEVAVPASGADNYVGANGDPANWKAYCFKPDFAGTMTVNYAAGGPDVITLTADQPIAWNNASGLDSHFTVASTITSIDFANSGSTDGTVEILIARDGTP